MLGTSWTRSGSFWRRQGSEISYAAQVPHPRASLYELVVVYLARLISLVHVTDEASRCRSVESMLGTSRTRSGSFWRRQGG